MAAGVAGLALAGCGGGKRGESSQGGQLPTTPTSSVGGAQPVSGGTIRPLATVGSVLDPHRVDAQTESADLWARVGNFLMRTGTGDPMGLPEPDLALTLPEIPGDGTVLTFQIRPEARWQNRPPVGGRPVVAEDVKLTFERLKNPANRSPRSGNYANVERVAVLDDRTVQFRLKTPQADFVAILADQYDFVLPKEIASRGPEAITSATDVIGSGPYELATFEPGRGFTLKRRPDGYWRENSAWIDVWEYRHETDPHRLANALRSGQADAATLPADLARTFEGDPMYVTVSAPTPTRECVLVNHGRARYRDPRIRLALSRAIDRRQVYGTAFSGAGLPGGPMSPACVAWTLPEADLSRLPGYTARLNEIREAKALLAAAQVPDGFEDAFLTVSAFDMERVHDVVAANLAEVGIIVKTDNVGTDFDGTFRPRETQRQFSAATTLFLAGPYPDAQLLLYHHSDTKNRGTRNYGDYVNRELDAKLEKQSRMYDRVQRRELVQEIQRDIINAPGPAWLGSRLVYTVYSAKVRNAAPFPFAAGYHSAENMWLKP